MPSSRLLMPCIIALANFYCLDVKADEGGSAQSAKLFAEASKARDAKDYSTCISKAEAAWRSFEHAQIRGLQGLCELESGKYADAASHLAIYVNGASSAVEPEMTAGFARAKERVAELNIVCRPDRAEIAIDGRTIGKGSTTVYLEPGSHTIVAKSSGLDDHDEKRELAAGTKVAITIELAQTRVADARPLWPGILGLTLAGGALVTGIATTVASNGASSDASDASHTLGKSCSAASPAPACQKAFDSQNKANTLGNVSIAMFRDRGRPCGGIDSARRLGERREEAVARNGATTRSHHRPDGARFHLSIGFLRSLPCVSALMVWAALRSSHWR